MDVNLKAPHIPHWVTEDLWQRYAGCGDLPEYGVDAAPARHPYAVDLRRHFHTEAFTESRTRAHRRAYYGRVSYVDAQLGRLLDRLEQTGQADNTVVVYTSDHGEMLGMFGMWFKSSMYEDSARVPLIVAGPGFGRGVRVRTPVSQWDLGAAMFTATRVTRPSGLAGEPLQHLRGDDTNRAVFAEYHGHGTRGSAYIVRQDQWKLIYNARAPHQLFDLDDDPHELHNLAAKAPGTLRALIDRLNDEFCDPEREQRRAETFIRHQLRAANDQRTTPGLLSWLVSWLW
jgi:choline-sulfatase